MPVPPPPPCPECGFLHGILGIGAVETHRGREAERSTEEWPQLGLKAHARLVKILVDRCS
jgi:hypothetical protein